MTLWVVASVISALVLFMMYRLTQGIMDNIFLIIDAAHRKEIARKKKQEEGEKK